MIDLRQGRDPRPDDIPLFAVTGQARGCIGSFDGGRNNLDEGVGMRRRPPQRVVCRRFQ